MNTKMTEIAEMMTPVIEYVAILEHKHGNDITDHTVACAASNAVYAYEQAMIEVERMSNCLNDIHYELGRDDMSRGEITNIAAKGIASPVVPKKPLTHPVDERPEWQKKWKHGWG